MAEHPHSALVRAGYEAFSRGDMQALSEIIAKDAAHHVPGRHAMAGDKKGLDAILTHHQQLAVETGGTLRSGPPRRHRRTLRRPCR